MTGFRVRGVIEGFYGPVWPWAERLDLVPFLAARGFNAYAYAPKNDPLHRDRWREPYLPEDWDRFAQLTHRCAEADIDFVFGVSPLGLRFTDLEPDADDLGALIAKFAAADAIGVRTFCLLVDDMPARGAGGDATSGAGGDATPGAGGDLNPGDAPATPDVRLVQRVHRAVTEFGPGRRLWFVPQPYCGDTDTPYLRQLGREVPLDVDICWTGPQVCAAEVTLEHARAVEASLRRPFLLWDNHPVNDGGMRHDPHLGPLRGRDPRLPEAAAGIVANLALQPEASRIAVATVGEYAADPASTSRRCPGVERWPRWPATMPMPRRSRLWPIWRVAVRWSRGGGTPRSRP
ncbi:MAG: beta-N-acetylglucosaminidase domain-containing protein [Egibacteraceae bacterium]